MTMLKNKKLGFIGGGAMAEALIKGLLNAGLVEPDHLAVAEINEVRREYIGKQYQIGVTDDAKMVARSVDVLFLTIKPQVIQLVLAQIGPVVPAQTTVISVAAGITLTTLQEKMPGVPIVRVMPNTPVAVGEGMAAYALGEYADASAGQLAGLIFSSVGKAVAVEEGAMDAITGLSGSGPAYAFLMIDALADAGVRVGLSRQVAIQSAAQTLLGAAKMVLETGEHPARLRDMVTSPAGTTIAGVHVLEQGGVRGALMDAVVAATQRSKEMGNS